MCMLSNNSNSNNNNNSNNSNNSNNNSNHINGTFLENNRSPGKHAAAFHDISSSHDKKFLSTCISQKKTYN